MDIPTAMKKDRVEVFVRRVSCITLRTRSMLNHSRLNPVKAVGSTPRVIITHHATLSFIHSSCIHHSTKFQTRTSSTVYTTSSSEVPLQSPSSQNSEVASSSCAESYATFSTVIVYPRKTRRQGPRIMSRERRLSEQKKKPICVQRVSEMCMKSVCNEQKLPLLVI